MIYESPVAKIVLSAVISCSGDWSTKPDFPVLPQIPG